MRKYFLALIIGFYYCNSFGQRWETIYGNPGTDEAFSDLIETYDHGYLICSFFEVNNGCWLIKTDVNGSMIWEKFLTWQDVSIFGGFVDQDCMGNIYLSSVVYGDPTGYWPMITKLDSCGEKAWCRVFPNYDYELGWYNDVMVLENQDIIALAYFDTSAGNFDQVFLDYIDSDGNLLWRQVYASQENYPYIRSTGGDEIKKYGSKYLIHGHCYYPYPSNPTHVFLRPLFIMIDSLFNELWILPFGINDSIHGEAFGTTQLSDTVFLGVGMRRLPGYSEHSLLIYFDDKGNELGYAEIPNDSIGSEISQNYMNDIERINDSLFIGLTTFGIDNEDFFWGELIVDTSGMIYKQDFRPVGTNGRSKLVKTFDNKYVVGTGLIEGKTDWDIYMYKINEALEQDTLYPVNYTYDSLCPHQIQSGTIDISDCMIITNVSETPTPSEYYSGLKTIPIKAYPNPINGNEITFEFENTEHHLNMELRIYNIFGSEISKQKIYYSQLATEMNITTWPAGMYLAVIFSNGGVVGKSKFVVE